ncbi:hypothetical protein [Brevibacterium aurantiacum]|nr:hypothetical protein [Brevibacterium aurantiacum]
MTVTVVLGGGGVGRRAISLGIMRQDTMVPDETDGEFLKAA